MMINKRKLIIRLSGIVIVASALGACDQQKSQIGSTNALQQAQSSGASSGLASVSTNNSSTNNSSTNNSSTTNLYWGDTHLHTNNSGDAYFLGNRSADPDTAYRFAKGLPVIHPGTRTKIQLETPLDFLMVTDHAEYLGVFKNLFAGDPLLTSTKLGAEYVARAKKGEGQAIFKEIVGTINSGKVMEDFITPKILSSVWGEIVDSADRHNDPGNFTAFIGWEWSSLPDGANLHRVVFMPEDATVAKKFVPFSALDSDKPEDLWNWLETTGNETGANFVAIAHNSNVSKGKMFNTVDSEGRPITAAYARTRMRWEQVHEVTQIKGDSETHPKLSPDDEFADFETYEHLLDGRPGADKHASFTPGDYVRGALRRGMEIEQKIGVNPFKIGLIGATDAHTGVATAEEKNFWGKSAIDSSPEARSKEVTPGSNGFYMSAAGLAGVWAKENTRASLTAAFKRREVYGTSGPRIQVRLFGGWDFKSSDAEVRTLAEVGYQKGVPMGGDLTAAPQNKAPSFLVRAVKDPVDANLDRVQIVKGWLDSSGKSHEKVFNVAVSDEREIKNNKVKPVGNTVNLKTASYTNSIGDAELATVWTDPDFDSSTRAFYYARVLQIPTPRHSLYDAVALGIDPKETGRPAVIQERAYSSPIWYTP